LILRLSVNFVPTVAVSTGLGTRWAKASTASGALFPGRAAGCPFDRDRSGETAVGDGACRSGGAMLATSPAMSRMRPNRVTSCSLWLRLRFGICFVPLCVLVFNVLRSAGFHDAASKQKTFRVDRGHAAPRPSLVTRGCGPVAISYAGEVYLPAGSTFTT
jgi:hypothetical protein